MRFILILSLFCLAACSAQPTLPQSDLAPVIYTAETILTMDSEKPSAKAVAVLDDKIVGIGSEVELKHTYPNARFDDSFAAKTILPGLIDPHVHMILGAMMYGLDWIPPWDMPSPKGLAKGLPNKAALLDRIKHFEQQANDGPLILYGYHNLVQGDLTRQDLDAVSATRPLFIWHYSGHDFYLNSAAIALAGLTPDLADKFHGVGLDKNGELNGRIYEDAALTLFGTIGKMLLSPEHIATGFQGYETLLTQGGVTTVAEMGYGIFGRAIEDNYLKVFYKDDAPYSLYLIPEHRAFTKEFGEDVVKKLNALIDTKPRIPVLKQVKLFTDAAFYSQTMRMKAPGYIGGQSKGSKGLWVTEKDALIEAIKPYWEAGYDLHIHSNGDAAQDATLSALETFKAAESQRAIIEHLGLFTPAQIERAKNLDVGVSAASHYVHYMGEDYIEAIGEKTQYITPLASTMAAGIPTTVHSDAPLAPPQPLRAASVHATRLTRQGNVSTPSERLTAEQALRAITIEAAWSLGLEDEIGSLETGKRADFTILEDNPLEVSAENWSEIDVWGVVLKGEHKPIKSLEDAE